MFEDCKYRLPCDWCDKHDKLCELVQRKLDKVNEVYECNHEWLFYNSKETTVGKVHTFKCIKCGKIKVEDSNGAIYESGEWMV